MKGQAIASCHAAAYRSPGEGTVFELDAVSFRFPDGRLVLQDIALSIFEGDRIALVGPNGAGKTTLAKLLNGLYRPISGRINYLGQPVAGDHLWKTRLEVGILFQDPDNQLFSNTLYDDVAFGPFNQGLDRQQVELRVDEAMHKVGLQELLYKAPHHLSYGQKKRAALATLLSMRPQVLILDEPTANLDPKQEAIFFELLREFDGTLICISHDLPFLYRLCRRAVVLADGRLQHDLPMQDFISHRHSLRDHGLDFTFRIACCRNSHAPHPHQHHPPPHAAGAPSRDAAQFAPAAGSVAPPLLELQDYSYRYPDGTWGCRDISFSVQKGEKLALAGENGAGKSTLVACLMGILQGTGQYRFGGLPVDGKLRRHLWRHVGMVFQDPADQLFCPSCLEETAFGPKQLRLSAEEIQQRAREALAQVRLDGFEKRVPHHLSAGERKRLAIASVLSMRPEVLILDEPTANLDPRSEELILEILQQLDVTLLLITHDLFFITALCERTLVMHRGALVRDYPTTDFAQDAHLSTVHGLNYRFKEGCCQEIARLQQAAMV